MIAVIDTSTAYSALALVRDDTLVAEQQWLGGRNHSEQVLFQLDALCRLAGCTPQAITMLAVTLGPGSWSGIRVGISIAKGIALANDVPIIGVSTLDSMAWPYRDREAVDVCVNLGRARVAHATYPQHWEPSQIPPLNTPIADCRFAHAVVCDTPTWQLCGQPTPWYATPTRPLFVAQIAQYLRANPHIPASTVEPIYLGDAVQRPA